MEFLKMVDMSGAVGLFHKVGNEGKQGQVAGAFNGLGHATLELQRGSGDTTGKDLALLVEELLEEFGILVIDVFDTAAFETAVFFLLDIHRQWSEVTDF